MRRYLGIDDAVAELRVARTGRRRPAQPATAAAAPPKAWPTRHAPIGLRTSTASVALPPVQLRFARLTARGLYAEVDERARELLEAVEAEPANSHSGVGTLWRSLLDDPPDEVDGGGDGGEEWSLVLLFLDAQAVGCAFYRHSSPLDTSAPPRTTVGLLAVDSSVGATAALGSALLAYVLLCAARHQSELCALCQTAPHSLTSSLVEETPSELEAFGMAGDGADAQRFVFFSQLVRGEGAAATCEQTAYLQRCVRSAEQALLGQPVTPQLNGAGGEAGGGAGGAGGAGSGGSAFSGLQSSLPRVGDLIAIWMDKHTLATAHTSQHYLAQLRTPPREQLHAGIAPSAAMAALRLPQRLASQAVELAVAVQWVGGTDDGETREFRSGELGEISPRQAADREMSLACGYATLEHGRPPDAAVHTWTRLAIEVGGDGWHEQLHDEARPPPQLLLSWGDEDSWRPSAELVMRRDLAAFHRLGALSSDHPILPRTTASLRASASASAAAVAVPGQAEHVMVEFFCGQAPLAWTARNTQRMRVLGLDHERAKVFRAPEDGSGDGEGILGGLSACSGGPGCQCKQLHEHEYLEEDFMHVPCDHIVLDRLLGTRHIRWAHFGIECDSFSRLTQGENHRGASNYWMGDSPKAYEGNTYVHHMVALCYLLRRRYPDVILSIENPDGALAHHPLVRHLLEQSEDEGGLGLRLMPVSYCHYDRDGPQKVTLFWSNSREMYLDFVETPADGTPRLRRCCGRNGCDCGDLKNHLRRRERGVRGCGNRWNTETYPEGLCRQIVSSVHLDITSKLASMSKLSDIGEDGSYGHCMRCDADGELHQCYGCPRTYHPACVPPGAKHREDGAMLCEKCASVGWQVLQPERE